MHLPDEQVGLAIYCVRVYVDTQDIYNRVANMGERDARTDVRIYKHASVRKHSCAALFCVASDSTHL